MPSAIPSVPVPDTAAARAREAARHYIAASDADVKAMLKDVGASSLADLFAHIPASARMVQPLPLPEELSYDDTARALQTISLKNRPAISFLGDGLPVYREQTIVPFVWGVRKLSTAYTPYQPERSQGTLITHWIYQCAMSALTGFEAINASLYDRAGALYEAVCCAIRLAKTPQADTVLVAGNIYPADLEVLRTLAIDTKVNIETIAPDAQTGRLAPAAVRERAMALGARLAGIAFAQVNNLGILEDVDALADIASDLKIKAIAVIDPVLLAEGGLKPPSRFGKNGADIIVGEGQPLTGAPNFGGPGLGIFGVRLNAQVKNDVRATAGRFVGKAKDASGRDCFVMVLSAREQHIRKDKATSNICSNQAFMATVAGAALVQMGDSGLSKACAAGFSRAREFAQMLGKIEGLALAYADAPFANEVTIVLPEPSAQTIEAARKVGLHAGVDVSDRVAGGRHLLKISFSDMQTPDDMGRLERFLQDRFGARKDPVAVEVAEIPAQLRRADAPGILAVSEKELQSYYLRLGELNVSPDEACYPLGSCTMKYNPYLNDWAAGLPGFALMHPQAPVTDAQGSLELAWTVQEWMKAVTGLCAVTTQPVSGAQGELVGLKLIQAYHRDHGGNRDVIFIPKSAHGTNFATAAMAGFETRTQDGRTSGIVLLERGADGLVDMADFEQKLALYGDRLAAIMVTNPNTSGLFETRFGEIAEKVHAAGGLVYMDGANMNAIAGWVNVGTLGVDALHNNVHKTWAVSHGGGGPGDCFVAVSDKLADYLPGSQVVRRADGSFEPVRAKKCIGMFHRHWGNFAHKARMVAYLFRLGREGIPAMSGTAVLAARYLFAKLSQSYPSLPEGAEKQPRMHEFILTLTEDDFAKLEQAGVPRQAAIARVGKLFLDFGFHAPTVAFPEVFGLMIEPTESYAKSELDRFGDAVLEIHKLVREHPEAAVNAPHFTPVERVDDVTANRNLVLSEPLRGLPDFGQNRVEVSDLAKMSMPEIAQKIIAAG